MATIRHRVSNEEYQRLRDEERPAVHRAAAAKEALVDAVLDAFDKGNRLPAPVAKAIADFRSARAHSVSVRYSIREQDELRRESA